LAKPNGAANALFQNQRPQASDKRISWDGILRKLLLDELWLQEW